MKHCKNGHVYEYSKRECPECRTRRKLEWREKYPERLAAERKRYQERKKDQPNA